MPMHQRRIVPVIHLACALLLAATFAWARAAELGDVAVSSHIGQPLVADIELTNVADPAQAVSVRLASPDVYKGANIGIHPALASVNLSVMRRDGRQFLHITSVKSVDTEYIHLFLDLGEGGKRSIRAATLWLTPDPTPPAPAPLPVPVALPSAKPAMAAPDATTRATVPVLSLPRKAAPASCPAMSDEKVKACAAIDYKNGLLSAQIVELEEKVKALQLAMAAKSEPAASAPKPAPVAHAKPVTPPLLVPKPKPAPVEEAGFPWLWVSLGVLLIAAIGGGVYFVISRKKTQSVETAAADSVAWYTRLTARFKRKPKPILEVPEEVAAEQA
ncbi:MAG: FimV family protein [Massilia sp.]